LTYNHKNFISVDWDEILPCNGPLRKMLFWVHAIFFLRNILFF